MPHRNVASETPAAVRWTLWGRGAWTHFAGDEGELTLPEHTLPEHTLTVHATLRH